MGPVFVVEDDLEIARLMRYHLEQASYAVQCYTTTLTAHARAPQLTPTLYILDVM